MNDKNSCAKRFESDVVHHRYTINRLRLMAVIPADHESNIMPNTLTHNLHPLHAREFAFEV